MFKKQHNNDQNFNIKIKCEILQFYTVIIIIMFASIKIEIKTYIDL